MHAEDDVVNNGDDDGGNPGVPGGSYFSYVVDYVFVYSVVLFNVSSASDGARTRVCPLFDTASSRRRLIIEFIIPDCCTIFSTLATTVQQNQL